MRSGDAVKSADRAFLETLAERSQRPVLHNLIAARDDRPEFHKGEIEWVRDCNDRGLRIIGQGSNVRTWFSFTLDLWNLYDYSPAWNQLTQGTREERLTKMADPARRGQLKEEEPMLASVGEQTRPKNLTIVRVPDGNVDLGKYVGCKLSDIAEDEGKDPVDVMLDIAVAGNLDVEFRGGDATSSNPDLVGELMRDPFIVAGVSDGGAHVKFFTGGSYTTDLLTWLVRDTGKLTLEEAHFHLSYLPAQAAGFSDRGFLKEGAPADIVVYDLENLKRVPEWDYEIAHDFPANEWRRVQRAQGYRWVMVNGTITFEDDECTGATPGQLLLNRRIPSARESAAMAAG